MKKFQKVMSALFVGMLSLSTLSFNAQAQDAEKPFEGTVLEVSLAYGGAEPSFDVFTEETGIEIEYINESTGAKLSQLQAEEGLTTTDIWFGGGIDSHISASELGYLYQYRSPEADNISEQYVDEDGYYTALAIVPHGLIVNDDLIEELGLDYPETWADLTDPQYAGELVFADPSISGGQYAIHTGILQHFGEEEGWEILQGIWDNVGFEGQSGGDPAEKTSSGEFAIGLTAITGGTYGRQETAPVSMIFLDTIPWTPAPISIFENSENKEAAEVFVDWYLSEHGQTVLQEADDRIMANENVELSDQMSEALDLDKLVDLDLVKMGEDRDMVLERWTEIKGE